MAAPILGKVAAVVGKKLAADVLTDPSVILKYILYFFGAIFAIVLLFFGSIYFLYSVPSALFNGTSNDPAENELFKRNQKLVSIYNKMPSKIETDINKWMEEQKSKYSETEFYIENKLEWQAVLALDAVKYKQDFSRVTEDEIILTSNKFVYKDMKTVTYTAVVPELDKDGKQILDKDGNPRTKTVTKTKYVFTVRIKSLDELMNEMQFDSTEKSSCNEMYNFTKFFNIEQELNIYDNMNIDISSLEEYSEGNANIPYFSQADKRWAAEPYGMSGNIFSSGCGPTALAMVAKGLTGRADINPSVVAKWSYENGYRCEGAGSYWSLITDGGNYYGLNVTSVSRKDTNSILKALSDGYPVIVAMGPGTFTKGGHFIVLRGLTKDKKILVNDSISVKRSSIAWDANIIFNESSMNGGYDGHCFWILKRK